MTAEQTEKLRRAEALLRQLMAAVGIRLPPGELRLVSPAQAALLDFMAEHPFATLHELEVHAGEPISWSKEIEGKITEKFRAGRG